MEPRITLLTLGVADLERSVGFYRDGLKWPTTYQPGEGVAFFNTSGTRLALFGLKDLCEDISAQTQPSEGGFGGITIAHNVRTKEEVAVVLAEAERAGGKIIKPAQDVFWGGHSGYFADPDGHYWEVAWNPGMPLDEDGMLTLSGERMN